MQKLRIVSLETGSEKFAFSSTAQSVLNLKSNNWQWIIEDSLIKRIENVALKGKILADQRISVVGSTADVQILDLADSWGVVFLHPGFQLAADFVTEIEKHKSDFDFELLYSDVQLLDVENRKIGIWRRPHNCFERLLHHNYVSGAAVVSKEVVEQVCSEGAKSLYEIEYQSICSVMARKGSVRHVFEPLVSAQRQLVAQDMLQPTSSWLEQVTKSASSLGQGFVLAPGPTGNWGMRRLPKEKVSISIVIPTRGDKKRIWGIETDLIENVVQSLFQKTTNEEFEVIVVHDVNTAYGEHARSLAQYGNRIKMVPYEKPFNFADKCNVGALSSSAHLVVFLNDDIEVIDPWWLDHLVGYLESPEVGAVGPVLLLDNGMVQSAGHVNQPLPANYHSGKPFGVKSFPEPLDIPCEVSGLTAACVAVRREVFDEVGGFCEDLPNNFNDVDFCLKIQETGRSLIWTPLARLYHFETTTRVTTVTEEETQFIKDRWGRTFGVDLYRSRID